jgi:hypothetical protein
VDDGVEAILGVVTPTDIEAHLRRSVEIQTDGPSSGKSASTATKQTSSLAGELLQQPAGAPADPSAGNTGRRHDHAYCRCETNFVLR